MYPQSLGISRPRDAAKFWTNTKADVWTTLLPMPHNSPLHACVFAGRRWVHRVRLAARAGPQEGRTPGIRVHSHGCWYVGLNNEIDDIAQNLMVIGIRFFTSHATIFFELGLHSQPKHHLYLCWSQKNIPVVLLNILKMMHFGHINSNWLRTLFDFLIGNLYSIIVQFSCLDIRVMFHHAQESSDSSWQKAILRFPSVC